MAGFGAWGTGCGNTRHVLRWRLGEGRGGEGAAGNAALVPCARRPVRGARFRFPEERLVRTVSRVPWPRRLPGAPLTCRQPLAPGRGSALGVRASELTPQLLVLTRAAPWSAI